MNFRGKTGWLVALVTISVLLMAAKITTTNLKIGRKADENITIEADIGLGNNNPKMQYNAGTDAWQFANDGSNFFDFGSGSGGGSGGLNIVDNADYESGTTNWTASGGSFSTTTNATNLINGGQTGQWDANALDQTLEGDLKNLPNKLVGNSCSVQVSYKADAAMASGDYVLRVEDQSGADVLPNNPDAGNNPWVELEPNINGVIRAVFAAFTCPNVSQLQPILQSKVADAPEIFLDDWHLGSNIREGTTTALKFKQFPVDTYAFTPNGGASSESWTTRRSGNMLIVQGWAVPSNTAVNSFLTMPAGLTIDLSKYDTGENNVPVVGHGASLVAGPGNFEPINLWVDPAGSTNQIWVGKRSSAGKYQQTVWSNLAPDISVTFEVPIVEWSADGENKTVTLETQGWRIRGNIGGALIPLSTVDSAPVGEFDPINNGSIDLVAAAGSQPVNIACDNAAAGTTTCSGTEQVGINFNAPYAGDYRICFDFGTEIRVDALNEFVGNVYRVVIRNNANNNILQDNEIGQFQAEVSLDASVDIQPTDYHRVCDTYTLAAGETTASLYFHTAVTGTPPLNQIVASRSSGTGFPTIGFEVLPVSQKFPQAVAIANVETGATADCDNGNICSGTYTPVAGASLNVDATAVSGPFRYIRLGNVVHGSGFITLDVTASGTDTQQEYSLPIATDFTAGHQLSGVCSLLDTASNDNNSAIIEADAANDTWQLRFRGTISTASKPWSCMFTYELQ